jgi:cytoskeletal protein CcmA (bactofilin family)
VNNLPTVEDVKDASCSRRYRLDPLVQNLSFAKERVRIMAGQFGVLSNERLRIAGQQVKIVSLGKIEIDSEFEGDVTGDEVVVKEQGNVNGTVAGERVVVLGKISGGIRGKTVILMSSARVEGEIHQMSLAIEAGAEFVGRCRLNAA